MAHYNLAIALRATGETDPADVVASGVALAGLRRSAL
jgi:hypothetical protein